MRDGKLIEWKHPLQHYRTVFNQRTGFFIRKEESGNPEPTWAMDGPELIDLSITNYCERGCKFCYRNTEIKHPTFLGLEEIKEIVSQAHDCGTMQIALGGGNPNQHPHFREILEIIRKHEIVPSYTSNGDGLTKNILTATADFCGAMAISFYPPYSEDHYENMLKNIKEFGIKTNIHAIIRNETLDMWKKWLIEPPSFFKYVNAIIFLNYKPTKIHREQINEEKIRNFFTTVNKCNAVKIGFDSCSMSGIVQWMDTPSYLLEPCEAARFSAFISEDMKMYPCSFMVNKDYFGDLRKDSLIDIWQKNRSFIKFRDNSEPNRCKHCKNYTICKGGCRLFDEINFCQNYV